MNTHKNIYQKTSHFVDMLENTKIDEKILGFSI